MKVGVVVVVYSEYPSLCLEGIVDRTVHDVSWFIHSHTSDVDIENKLLDFVEKHHGELTLHGYNRGLSRSWNDGIWRSFQHNNDITLVINDDVCFKQGAFDEFINFLRVRPGFSIGVLHGEEPTGPNGSVHIVKQDWACFAIGYNAFGKIGAFDENLFPAYCEDVDYDWRGRVLNMPVSTDQRVLVEHERNKSTKLDASLREALITAKARNWTYFCEKWSSAYPGPEGGTSWPPIRIGWAARVRPDGLPIRHDLKPEQSPKRMVSFLPTVIELSEVELFHNARVRSAKACEAWVTSIYLALLGRLPDPSALEFYVNEIVDGHLGLPDFIEVIKNSKECRRLSIEKEHAEVM